MDEEKIEKMDATSTTAEMKVSTTERPKVKTSLVGRLNNYLTSLKKLEALVEQTQPKKDTLMGSRFMKNRLRHQIEDLQRSLERYITQLQQEQEA